MTRRAGAPRCPSLASPGVASVPAPFAAVDDDENFNVETCTREGAAVLIADRDDVLVCRRTGRLSVRG